MQRRASTAFLHQVRRTIARYEMVQRGGRVLVALSGGPDSVALLAALVELASELEIEVHAAHLNHQLRGVESVRDQHCAELIAQRLGVGCVTECAHPLAGKGNLEARAREVRYAFLERVAASQACTRIATGHTLDDQAETVLMRLLRGTGADGLAGIRPVRDARIVRPLIECSRQQVLAFLEASALPFCHDSSNDDPRFLRNRVRHQVLPLLRTINPAVTRRLAAMATTVTAEADLLEDRARASVAAGNHNGALAVSAIGDAPAALRARIVRAWLQHQRGNLRQLSAAHVQAVVALAGSARPNARVRLPGRQLVVREYGHLRWQRQEVVSAPETTCVLVPGASVCLGSGWRISAAVVELSGNGWEPPRDLCRLDADADAIAAPLIVRTARRGDRMRLLGLNGHRKLQDLFVDHKLPQRVRQSCPVIECDGEILWVPGVARSDAALVTESTRATLSLIAERTGTGIAGPKCVC